LVPVAGSCEHGNEPSASIKGGKFPDWLSDCYLLKKDSVPWSHLVLCVADRVIATTAVQSKHTQSRYFLLLFLW
jgi:hypothetical protein